MVILGSESDDKRKNAIISSRSNIETCSVYEGLGTMNQAGHFDRSGVAGQVLRLGSKLGNSRCNQTNIVQSLCKLCGYHMLSLMCAFLLWTAVASSDVPSQMLIDHQEMCFSTQMHDASYHVCFLMSSYVCIQTYRYVAGERRNSVWLQSHAFYVYASFPLVRDLMLGAPSFLLFIILHVRERMQLAYRSACHNRHCGKMYVDEPVVYQVAGRVDARDLCGGGIESELPQVGTKFWIDKTLEGLRARHLVPPVSQLKMLVASEATQKRLTNAKSLQQQLDIVCGAAFKAQLGWQKSSDPTHASSSKESQTITPPIPPIETWRLRAKDFKQVKPADDASKTNVLSPEGRQDVFRQDASGDSLSAMWSRTAGAYLVDATVANQVLKAIPVHSPPAGLFSLLTTSPTPRSDATPVEVVVMYPDNSVHLTQLFVSNIGVDKLVKVDIAAIPLATVESVEVLIEWWSDLVEGPQADAFRQCSMDSSAAAKKGSDKGKGKGRGAGKGHTVHARNIALVNSTLKDSLVAGGAGNLDSCKWYSHQVFPEIIRVCLRVPKPTAIAWLTKGTGQVAITCREVNDLAEMASHRRVWIPAQSELLQQQVRLIPRSLSLALAGVGAPWSIVRAPNRWGVRAHSDHEQQVKAILQPNAVYVPPDHRQFVIQNVPKHIDPECIAKTNSKEQFKPYVVTCHRAGGSKKVVLAAACAPQDIVCVLSDERGKLITLLLEEIQKPAGSQVRSTSRGLLAGEASPKRKVPRNQEGADTQGGNARYGSSGPADLTGGGPTATSNRYSHLPNSADEDFPPLPTIVPTKPQVNRSSTNRPSSIWQGQPSASSNEALFLRNKGNTCYAAAACNILRHVVWAHSQLRQQLQDIIKNGTAPSLHVAFARLMLVDVAPAVAGAWDDFCQAAHLGGNGAVQEDVSVYLLELLGQFDFLAKVFEASTLLA